MNSKKTTLATIFIMMATVICLGQNIQLYNAEYLPQSLMMNPGTDIKFDRHYGIPLLSGIHAQVGSTGISVHDIFKKDRSTTINQRIEDAILSLSRKDFFTASQHLEILSIGWRDQKDRYFSAGWYEELDAFGYFPKDVAILAYYGNADYLNRSFDFSDISGRGELLSVFHIGANKKVSKNLTLGARFKIYSSMLNATSIGNEGRFITTETPEGTNFYRQQISGLDASLKFSGIAEDDDLTVSNVLSNSLFGGNYGAGIDLGMTYKLGRQWQVTASLVDLGMIFHQSKTREVYARGSYDFDGIGFVFPSVGDGDTTIKNYFNDIRNDFKENVATGNGPSGSYTMLRPVKLYGSLEYRFGEPLDCNCLKPERDNYRFRTGLSVFAVKRPHLPYASVTGYLDARLVNFLHTKLTYTVDPFSATNIGFLVSAQINKFNLYLSADNLLEYQNLAKARTASLQFGFQFIINND